MTTDQVHELASGSISEEDNRYPELIETHISWVLLFDDFVFKIKKPIHYSFLDFSTLGKRKYYCEREVILNKRLTEDIYLDVQPVRERSGCFRISGEEGEIIDYVVRMRRLDNNKQMDRLLANDKVSSDDIRRLAEKIAGFHQSTEVIWNKDILAIKNDFDDLEGEKDFLQDHLDKDCSDIINRAIGISNRFMDKAKSALALRLQAGFFRDCHGDLHSRNIFLLPEPQPFDCIEFNDDFRRIDVLNEIAFLCMDLEAANRRDMADLFFSEYNRHFPTIHCETEKQLFIYYKSYRANIRAKVNSLRARQAKSEAEEKSLLAEVRKYLQLMNSYLQVLETAL